MSRNLTPIMLVIGPLMLVGAFFSWPRQNEVGMEAVELLRDDAAIVLAAGGGLGMSLMFGGLHLLSMDMKKGADIRPFPFWIRCTNSSNPTHQ